MKKKLLGLVLILFVILPIPVGCQISESDGVDLEVHFIDVGQGEAILIKKGNESMLIDAGKNVSVDLIVSYLKKQKVRKLEYVIGTHPHEDHIGGLDAVIDNFDIGKVIMPNAIATTKTFEDVLDSINKKGLSITKAKSGDIYDFNGASFIILAPNQDEYSNLNNYSVVVKLTYGANSFLFTGDAEAQSEEEILTKNKRSLKADVLKVGHHGSVTSTTQDFLDAVNPSVAVISLGAENTYGHPHKEIAERLESKKIKTYRTDLHGNIIAISDGESINFNTSGANSDRISINSSPEEEIYYDVIISKLDKFGELVTIQNNSSEDIDLYGWKLLSVRGNQEYIFPEYILKANGVVTVTSGQIDGDLEWGSVNIWNNTQSDPAILFDSGGNQVFKYDD